MQIYITKLVGLILIVFCATLYSPGNLVRSSDESSDHTLSFPIIVENAHEPIAWVEDGMTWVLKNDPTRFNSIITLYTAKNEYEPFQIIVKAPATNNLTNVNVTVSDLIGPNGASISSENITLYREHYLYVTKGSKSSNSETNIPLGPGWYPDALIPFVHPTSGNDLSGRFDAVPFNVTSGDNQPIWVDIYTPENTPPGQYNANATITSDQGSNTVNIILNVWNFSLPEKRSLHAITEALSLRKSRPAHEEFLKHRLNPKYVNRVDEQTLINNYALDIQSIWLPSGANRHGCNKNPVPSVSDVLELTSNHEPELYLYSSYANEVWNCTELAQFFLDWASVLRAGNSHPMIVTYPTDALMGTDLNNTAADIWAILPRHYDAAKANIDKLIANPTTEVWFYNPYLQDGYSPKFTIDFLPINSRIFHGFIGQSLGATGLKFWRMDNWPSDPWTNAEKERVDLPGEGHMVYPGNDIGLPGYIAPSLRLKLVREGSEDFEYIEILKNLDQEQFALDIARSVGADFHNWTQDKNALMRARKQLGDKIHALNSSPLPRDACKTVR